uniref:Uncharacterized protein n=1 Tax=Knipowitschia caucasica TaxID=637954 RepID=A0AAV2M0T9_KNICA
MTAHIHRARISLCPGGELFVVGGIAHRRGRGDQSPCTGTAGPWRSSVRSVHVNEPQCVCGRDVTSAKVMSGVMSRRRVCPLRVSRCRGLGAGLTLD